LRKGLGFILVGVLLSAPGAARAEGEDPAAIEKVTNLNKKALDAYNNLEFEDARKLLKQALDLCGSAGLDKHPIKARTHIHMGVVLIAAKQQELGVKQFRKALDIQPDIQVTKALANPEIIQAFEEAGSAGGGDAGGGDSAAEGTTAPPNGGEPATPSDIAHVPVKRAKKGRPVSIVVSVSPELTGYTKVVIAYRADGGPEFLPAEMHRSGSRWSGEIPAEATRGRIVHYYVEAEAEDETAVASAGSEERPYTVTLGSGDGDGGGDDDDDDDERGPPLFVSILGGTGIGYATGNGEVNADNKVASGFAPSSAAQIIPEVGYFLSPHFRLSGQLRYQVVSGATPQNLDALSTSLTPEQKTKLCGADHLCSPANYAVAFFGRASWFFGSGTFRPYFSLAAGFGNIRHIVTFTSLKTASSAGTCGKSGREACVDTVLAGPIFGGPGGGLLINITDHFGVLIDIASVIGFPKFTYHLDFNGGVAARF
ncbi:MAG: tetratricopeptide repeat protein, partial [Verrucomicrobiota bacterium]